MKQMLFIAALLLLGKTATAQTVTIINSTGCAFTIAHQSFTAMCTPTAPPTPAVYNVPGGTPGAPATIVVAAMGGIETFSVMDPCGGPGNTTVGTAPCHSQTAIPYIPPCLCGNPLPTGISWIPAPPPATGGTLNIF